MGALQLVTALLRQLLQSRATLVAENLALRHQIVILQRSVKRPRLHRRDRIFWVWLSRLWQGRGRRAGGGLVHDPRAQATFEGVARLLEEPLP